MAFWMELHCDSPPDGRTEHCAQMVNNHPGVLVSNAGTTQGLKALRKEAKRRGYVRTSTGWLCRHCAAALTASK